jgi:hypothetical protein
VILLKILKKAQGATEYLIILAIVIIIALIVVGVMGGIPGIGGQAGGRTSASYWSNADVAIVSQAISASGTDTVILKNNLRDPITVTNFTVNSVELASDETVGVGSQQTYTGAIAACTAGQGYSYDVSITYTDSKTDASYTFTGDGNKLEGTCAN